MKTWRQISQTAGRLDAEIWHGDGADEAKIVDVATLRPLVTIAVDPRQVEERDRDVILRAAVDAALLKMRRLGA